MQQDKKNYKPLAIRYRPQLFEDVIGQEVLVRTMQNAITYERIPNSLILTGIRGVGKTTTARIIARALNCIGADGQLSRPALKPCGVCNNCIAITESRHQDVLEMDAASNTSVNDVRIVIENAAYRPTSARYKIYIIDEVHMLSNSAFNALLKTLEEPPSHIKFIFATTEVQKIPVTILSRCQKFYLRRVSIDALIAHYARVLEKEGARAEPDALYMIAKAADGSVRDGLSILDQAIALSDDNLITSSIVKEMLGLASQDKIYELFENIALGDIPKVLSLTCELYENGADPAFVLSSLLEIVYYLTLFKSSPENIKLILPEAQKNYIERLAPPLSLIFLSRTWQMLAKGIEELKSNLLPFESLEMVLIRVAYASTLDSPEQILKQLSDNPSSASPVLLSGGPKAFAYGQPLQDKNFAEKPSEVPGNTSPRLSTAEAASAPPEVSSVEALIQLFFEHGEMVLCYALQNDIAVIEIASNHIKLQILNDRSPNIGSQIQQKLSSITGIPWKVELVQGLSAISLTESEGIKHKQKEQEVLESELVQSVLKQLPGTEVSHISISQK